MFFGVIETNSSEGHILAHAQAVPGRVLKKGRVLAADDVAQLSAAGVTQIFAARLEQGDVGEDLAAERIARALAGPGVTLDRTRTGRCNLIARYAGLVDFDAAEILTTNLIDEAITFGTVPRFARVWPGQVIATVKIIPLAVREDAVRAAETTVRSGVSVLPFKPLRVALLQTRAKKKETLLDKLSSITAERLAKLGSEIVVELRCGHNVPELAAAIGEVVANEPDLLLIAGITAVMDRRDVLPAAIEHAGGKVLHLGMPVDPGNLLLLAELEALRIIGLPGCARSPSLNGFDWVLERVAAGVRVGRVEIAAMAAGGLLIDAPERPWRAAKPPDQQVIRN